MNDSQPLVVVTRPEPDHAGTIESLRQRGLSTVASPAFDLVPRPTAEIARALDRLRAMDFVIVVSPFAARLIAQHGTPVLFEDTLFIAPGAGTARILERAGAEAVHPAAGGTSEAILALPELDGIEGRAVGIFGAPGGRRLLDEELARRGAEVHRFDGYRRAPRPPADALVDALANGRRLAVLVSSMNAFRQISDDLPEVLRARWLESRFVVSSPRLERACRDRGAGDVTVASGAADEAMIDALARLE